MNSFLQQQTRRIVAIVIVALSYAMVGSPQLDDSERAEIAARFSFKRQPLHVVNNNNEARTIRAVQPSYDRHAAWISSVGAAVALADLDCDGLPNDVVHVDPRTDDVIVSPVPGTPIRYEPFVLHPQNLPLDPKRMAPMGCIPSDLNEDGVLDVLVYYWGRSPVGFIQVPQTAPESLAASRFVPCEIVTPVECWNTNAATFADVDGDGHSDLVIGNYFPDGTRVLDTTDTANLRMQDSMTRAFNGGRNRILLWTNARAGQQPMVEFVEAADVFDELSAQSWTLSCAASDLDGDLRPELYFANDFGPDVLLHNRSTPGRPSFVQLFGRKLTTTPTSKVLGYDVFKGMGAEFGDLDGDADVDLLVSNIADEFALEESHFAFVNIGEPDLMRHGIAPFIDESEPLGLARDGWGWEVRMADFDNDGQPEVLRATGFIKGEVNRWPELHELAMANDQLLKHPGSWFQCVPGDDLSGSEHNPFYARASNGRFYDVAKDIGLGDEQVTRAIATADVDGDGRIDFVCGNQWETSWFYRNDSPSPGEFLGLKLLHATDATDQVRVEAGHNSPYRPGIPAIGATVNVFQPNGRQLVGQVDGGNGHAGVRSPDLHFGLGTESVIARLRVDIRWRDRRGDVHSGTVSLMPGWYTVWLPTPPHSDRIGQEQTTVADLRHINSGSRP